MTKELRLEAKVKAVNAANHESNLLYAKLVPIFEPLIGSQIFKIGGGLLVKIEKLLPKFPNTNNLMVYLNSSDYTLAWSVKANEFLPHGSIYHEATVYVGELERAFWLKSIMQREVRRADYTADEVTKLRETYREAKLVADDAKSALHFFGEYDR